MEASHGAAGAPAVVVVKEREVRAEKVVLEDLTVKRDLERERARVSGVTASRRGEDTVQHEVRSGATGTPGLKPNDAVVVVVVWYRCLSFASKPKVFLPSDFTKAASEAVRGTGLKFRLAIWKPSVTEACTPGPWPS